jgi:hypothetical protein
MRQEFCDSRTIICAQPCRLSPHDAKGESRFDAFRRKSSQSFTTGRLQQTAVMAGCARGCIYDRTIRAYLPGRQGRFQTRRRRGRATAKSRDQGGGEAKHTVAQHCRKIGTIGKHPVTFSPCIAYCRPCEDKVISLIVQFVNS